MTEQENRAEFERWYAANAFDYAANPIGSRECGLQWAAWRDARLVGLLEWREQVGGGRHFAKTKFGWYDVMPNGIPTYGKFGAHYPNSVKHTSHHDTIDEAKAACQAHYNEQVLGMLRGFPR